MPSGPIPIIPTAVWNTIKNKDISDGHWDDERLHLQEDGEGSFKWYLGEDESPLLVCVMSADDWSLIKGGTLEDNTITVGTNAYQIYVERGASMDTAAAKVRAV